MLRLSMGALQLRLGASTVQPVGAVVQDLVRVNSLPVARAVHGSHGSGREPQLGQFSPVSRARGWKLARSLRGGPDARP